MLPTRSSSTALLGLFALLAESVTNPQGVEVTITNGTIIGVHDPVLNVDSFLGVPYAQPPVGALRFEPPRALNVAWPSPLDASSYGPWCLGHTTSLNGFTQVGFTYPQSEDCLTLNIVRPASIPANASLPVLLWIHGGGFRDGGSSDLRYNMSRLAETSAAMGMPTITVSINYRLSGWGFSGSLERFAAGLGNNGLRDQMLALDWVQENIRAFGGDPGRVTIFGESAGAFSAGAHILIYADHPAPPFRAAIAESGSPLSSWPLNSLKGVDQQWATTLAAANCTNATDPLACLRSRPAEALHEIFAGGLWYLKSDGVLLPEDPALALERGAFAKVPLIIGTTTNEGTATVSSLGPAVNSIDELPSLLAGIVGGPGIVPNATMATLLDNYAALDLSHELGTVLPDPGPKYGSEYGRGTLFVGDIMFSVGRRLSNRIWDAHGAPSYSYRFDTIPAGIDPQVLGVTHFQEVPFVFGDTRGQGWSTNPFDVQPRERREKYEELAHLVSRMWISFANTLSPNNHGLSSFGVEWPIYNNSDPFNMVFDGTTTSYLEKDDWRADILDVLMNSDWCVSLDSQC